MSARLERMSGANPARSDAASHQRLRAAGVRSVQPASPGHRERGRSPVLQGVPRQGKQGSRHAALAASARGPADMLARHPARAVVVHQPQRQQPQIHTAQRIDYAARNAADIARGGDIHGLRPAFATHLLEGGADLYRIGRLPGQDHLSDHRYSPATSRVAGGALTPTVEWKSPKRELLLPVRPLSWVFRSQFMATLGEARGAGQPLSEAPADEKVWHALRQQLLRHDWVVYVRQLLGGPVVPAAVIPLLLLARRPGFARGLTRGAGHLQSPRVPPSRHCSPTRLVCHGYGSGRTGSAWGGR